MAKNINEDWLDGYFGLAYQMKLAPNWYWKTKADIGAGGSDLSSTVYSSLVWKFSDS